MMNIVAMWALMVLLNYLLGIYYHKLKHGSALIFAVTWGTFSTVVAVTLSNLF